jgi:hypothetical protein
MIVKHYGTHDETTMNTVHPNSRFIKHRERLTVSHAFHGSVVPIGILKCYTMGI